MKEFWSLSATSRFSGGCVDKPLQLVLRSLLLIAHFLKTFAEIFFCPVDEILNQIQISMGLFEGGEANALHIYFLRS